MTHSIVSKVLAVITEDLRKPEYSFHKHPLAGQCYVVCEAIYHLSGGRKAGWKPIHIEHEGFHHWYLLDPKGDVVDPTAEQFSTPVPYDLGKGKGFLTKDPSKRARIVIERVRNSDSP